MNEIGLFEAKTKFSEICERVAARGEAIMVTRRGKPLVKIGPISDARTKPSSIWDRRAKYEKQHGRLTEEFAIPRRAKQTWRNPLVKWTTRHNAHRVSARHVGLLPALEGPAVAFRGTTLAGFRRRCFWDFHHLWGGIALRFGIEKSARLLALYDQLLKNRLPVIPVEIAVAREFSIIKAACRKKGASASDFDFLIAATAKAHGLILATLNARHFQGIEGLAVENWLV
jgi:prevent-host-death family protein